MHVWLPARVLNSSPLWRLGPRKPTMASQYPPQSFYAMPPAVTTSQGVWCTTYRVELGSVGLLSAYVQIQGGENTAELCKLCTKYRATMSQSLQACENGEMLQPLATPPWFHGPLEPSQPRGPANTVP